MDLVEARDYVSQKLVLLENALSKRLNEDFRIFNGGSIETGLYYGPKPKSHSISPDCPFEKVVEADLRIVLSKTHPHNTNTLELIREVTGGSKFNSILHRHWNRLDFPISRSYWYEPLNKNIGFEWELTVIGEPYEDIAPYWERLFSSTEIKWQRRLRQLVTDAGIEHELYRSIKKSQTFEARWRLVASYALFKLQTNQLADSSIKIPIKGSPSKPIDFLCEKWLDGASGYRTMERPDVFISQQVKELLKQNYSTKEVENILEIPKSPNWVYFANQVQHYCKMKLPLNEMMKYLITKNSF